MEEFKVFKVDTLTYRLVSRHKVIGHVVRKAPDHTWEFKQASGVRNNSVELARVCGAMNKIAYQEKFTEREVNQSIIGGQTE